MQGEKIEFNHCPLAGNSDMYHKPQPEWSVQAECKNPKKFSPQYLAFKLDQNIFSLETCFACTSFEPEFTVCLKRGGP